MGVSPGRDTVCTESVCTPGETIVAWKMGVTRTRLIIVCNGVLLYMIGLSANSQEALSTYVTVYWIIIVYDRLRCQLAGGTLDVCNCIIELLLYMIGLSANSQEALSRAVGA